MRRDSVTITDFYEKPAALRAYALKQTYYTPYEASDEIAAGRKRPTWWATQFKAYESCPLKSDRRLIGALEFAVGEKIDMDHWRGSYPVDQDNRPLTLRSDRTNTCLWNCGFHVKPKTGQRVGDGIHNHVTDSWNSVGHDGWAGLVYLTPDAPLEGGLHLWRHRDPSRQFEWMSSGENWQKVDTFGNVFNRLILVRGDRPHSGADGWGASIEEGRLYQTFFFKTIGRKKMASLSTTAGVLSVA
jgi:hypothetical protein